MAEAAVSLPIGLFGRIGKWLFRKVFRYKLDLYFSNRTKKILVKSRNENADADFRLLVRNEGGAPLKESAELNIYTPVEATLVEGGNTLVRVIRDWHFHRISIHDQIGPNQSYEINQRFLLRFYGPPRVEKILYYFRTASKTMPEVRDKDGEELPDGLAELEIEIQ